MKYDPKIHHRRNLRLKGYDYSQAGLYFITICVKNRACLFGQIQNKKMQLNGAGRMVEKWYREIENKYPGKRCHEMMVMPNHIHCIIENTDNHTHELDAHVGAPLRGRPVNDIAPNDEYCGHNNNNDQPGTGINNEFGDSRGEQSGTGEKYGIYNKKWGSTIDDVMDWFKTMTTNEYIRGVKKQGWPPFEGKLWQRNYYDHIIRNEQSCQNISGYIINNPAKWDDDKFNPSNKTT